MMNVVSKIISLHQHSAAILKVC